MPSRPVEFNCKYCSRFMKISKWYFNNRTSFAGEFVCNKCLSRNILANDLFNKIPKKFHLSLYLKFELPLKIMIKYGSNSNTTKLHVTGVCSECGNVFRIRWDKVKSRKVYPFKSYCQRCVRLLTCRNKQVRINNSKIQLISQNTPERIKLNRETSRRLWYNNEYRIACLRAFQEHNKKIQQDPEYARKLRQQSKSICGQVLINNVWVDFDSSYELFFLYKNINKYKTIRRCEFIIMYGKHAYHPDFFVIEHDGTTRIIEIKGFYSDHVEEKKIAAEKYIDAYKIADSYELYDIDRLIKEGILDRAGSTHAWSQIQRIYNGQNIRFSHEKHREIATIGRSRFYKKIKNKKFKEKEI